MVTFFKSEALLKVFAKSSTWWHPSSRTDPAFSGSESALWGFDFPAIRMGSWKNHINSYKIFQFILQNFISHDMALNIFELCLPFLDYICRWLQWDQFLPEDYMCNHYLCIIPLPLVILMVILIRNTTLDICKYLSWKVSHNVLKDMCLLCLTKTTAFWTIKLMSVWIKIN